MVSFKQLDPALGSFGVNTEHLKEAEKHMTALLEELDEVEVKGRDRVDTLLGCMMAIEAIIGRGGNDGR